MDRDRARPRMRGATTTRTYMMKGIFNHALAGSLLLGVALTVRAELIVNGGFETGDFTGWSLSGTAQVLSGSPGSNYVHAGSYGATLGAGILSQTFLTSPGHVYDVSLWMNGISGGDPGSFKITWDNWSIPPGLDYGKVTLLDAFDSPDPIVGSGWARYDFSVLALGNISVLAFEFFTHPTLYPDNLAIDQVSVTDGGLDVALPPVFGVPIGEPSPVLPPERPYLLARSITLPTPVPEPSTYGVLGAVVLAVGALWRRRVRR